MPEPLLRLQGVSKSYAATDESPRTDVLKGIDLELSAGETLAIVGPSGSGKTTLLNLIGGLDRPTEGRIELGGKDLSTLSDDQLAGVRSAEIGYIFQLHHLLPQCTVLENVLIPTLATRHSQRPNNPTTQRPDDPPTQRPENRAKRFLERVGLGPRLNHRPGSLSGGERQRVAVVRALINEPGLLLADEPTGALDRASAENLADLLVELNKEEGVALIVSTHAMNLAERMGRLIELKDGRLA